VANLSFFRQLAEKLFEDSARKSPVVRRQKTSCKPVEGRRQAADGLQGGSLCSPELPPNFSPRQVDRSFAKPHVTAQMEISNPCNADGE
jgi:hypothetical protein